MPRPHHPSQKFQFAIALAQGASIAGWADLNGVPKRTAYRWAKDPKIRAEVESCRLRAIDRAIGRMSKRVTWAADGIARLAKNAESESVRLSALRAILSDMMAVSQFAGLEQRMGQIEEQLRERTGDENRTS